MDKVLTDTNATLLVCGDGSAPPCQCVRARERARLLIGHPAGRAPPAKVRRLEGEHHFTTSSRQDWPVHSLHCMSSGFDG